MVSSGTPVIIPLINANEPEARLSAIDVTDRQFIETGAEICTLETTKATHVIEAEADGYIRGLNFRLGQTVRAGEVLCYLAPSPEWEPPPRGDSPPDSDEEGTGPFAPENLRITRPALKLATESGIDPTTLPEGILVTEAHVRNLIKEPQPERESQSNAAPLDPNAIIVYGAGGHGKSVIDLIRAGGIYHIKGVVDDGRPAGEQVLDFITLGDGGVLDGLYNQGIRQAANAVGGIGDLQVRIRVFNFLKEAGFHCPELIHPSVVVEPSAHIGAGVQVFPQAYLGSDSRLGYGVIVNTGAIISHDCSLADYANISPGAILAGGVEIGEGSLVGMGVTVNLGVRVGSRARIGNGATLKEDVPDEGLVPAGSIWPS